MLTIDIAVFISDKQYAKALSQYLITYQPITFLVHCYTEAASLEMYLRNNPETLCLIDYISLNQIKRTISSDHMKQYLVLVEDLIDSTTSDQLTDFYLLNKLDLGGVIAKEVGKRFTEITTKVFPEVHRSHTSIVTLTELYETEKSFCENMITYIQPTRKHVLIISFDTLSKPPMPIVEDSQSNSLSDILYYLEKDPKQLSMIIEKVKCSDQTGYIHYIPKCQIGSHYFTIELEQINLLMDYLKTSLMYDLVIILLPGHYTKNNMNLITQSSHNILVTSSKEWQIKRHKSYMNQPEFTDVHFTNIQRGLVDQTILDDTFQYQFPNDITQCDKLYYDEQMRELINEVLGCQSN